MGHQLLKSRSAWLLPLAVIAGLVAGCTQTPATNPPAQANSARATFAAKAHDRSTRLVAAEELLIDLCMESRGQSYALSPTTLSTPTTLGSDPLIVDDLRSARRWGFGLRKRPKLSEDPNVDVVSELPQQQQELWNLAYSGSPGSKTIVKIGPHRLFTFADGCIALARAELYGSARRHLRISSRAMFAEQDVDDAVRQSTTIERHNRRWSRCMSRHDLDYVDPESARAAMARRGVNFTKERGVAVRSAGCAREVGLQRQIDEARQHFGATTAYVGRIKAWALLRASADAAALTVLERAQISSPETTAP